MKAVRTGAVKWGSAILFLTLAFSITACEANGPWLATVYPDKDDLSTSLTLGEWETLQDCGVASLRVLEGLHKLRTGDFECGKGCSRDRNSPSLWECEATTNQAFPFSFVPDRYERGGVRQALEMRCLDRIHQTYRPEYLTYPEILKGWLGSKAMAFGISTSSTLQSYIEGRSHFVDAVRCLAASSERVVPRLDMGPTVFEVYYNGLVEDLGIAQESPL
jgi:hypothetical protein